VATAISTALGDLGCTDDAAVRRLDRRGRSRECNDGREYAAQERQVLTVTITVSSGLRDGKISAAKEYIDTYHFGEVFAFRALLRDVIL